MHLAKRAWLCLLPLVLLAPATVLAAGPNDVVNVADYKPPVRVACLGDSITYGVGANTGWSWPEQLDRMLGDKWDVRNCGRSGATVAKGDKYAIWTQKEYFDNSKVMAVAGKFECKVSMEECLRRAAEHFHLRAAAYKPDPAKHALLDRVAEEQSRLGAGA